ncbi:MAG: hypothetical protein LBG28_05755, partial [Tannerella sp.]|nr:hypothetical protein [Tannerella sp.]
YTYYVRARVCIRKKTNKNKSFKPYFPIVVLIGINDETGFLYSQKQIQTTAAGVDFHRRPSRFIPLREEHALCNPPFL